MYRGSKRRYIHKPYLRAGPIPLRDKHSHKRFNNLKVRTLSMYQHTVILTARSTEFVLCFAQCNFVCLSAEHISVLVSSKYRRQQYGTELW
jgi:hypothetical protein